MRLSRVAKVCRYNSQREIRGVKCKNDFDFSLCSQNLVHNKLRELKQLESCYITEAPVPNGAVFHWYLGPGEAAIDVDYATDGRSQEPR